RRSAEAKDSLERHRQGKSRRKLVRYVEAGTRVPCCSGCAPLTLLLLLAEFLKRKQEARQAPSAVQETAGRCKEKEGGVRADITTTTTTKLRNRQRPPPPGGAMSSASCFGTLFRPVQHPTTSALLCVILVLSAAAGLGWRHSLSLIWNHTFMTQFYFWNVLTGSFVETSVLKLVASLIGVAGLGPAAEDSLGHLGLGAFVLCVGLASGFVTSCGVFMGYIVTRQEYLLDLELHGSFGVLAALAVAAAQQDASATLLPAGRAPWFPTRYLPLALVTASAVCRAFSVPVVAKDFPFVVVGAYVSWVYLRFFAHL
ncbi:unnamed protein product, partial [Ectocarpus fasciculatus]